MKARMQGLERRREALEAELATATEPKPRLHSGLAEIYRQKVAALHEALAIEEGHEVREAIRTLVEAIVLVPEEAGWRSRCGATSRRSWRLAITQTAGLEAGWPEDLLLQVKLVAGARCHLYRTSMSRRTGKRDSCLGILGRSAQRTSSTTLSAFQGRGGQLPEAVLKTIRGLAGPAMVH